MAYGQHFAQIAGGNGAEADRGRDGAGICEPGLARKDAGTVDVKAVRDIGDGFVCADACLFQQRAGKFEVLLGRFAFILFYDILLRHAASGQIARHGLGFRNDLVRPLSAAHHQQNVRVFAVIIQRGVQPAR